VAPAKTKKGVLKAYNGTATAVQDYFNHLPTLLNDYPLDVVLSYAFSQVELAHNMCMYCGVVKIHRAQTTLARSAIDAHHMTRDGFHEKFAIVFDKSIPTKISKKLRAAEDTRDKVMHGKTVTEAQKREALADLLSYAQDFNEFVADCAGFRPFGPLQGFKGRATPLDKNTTRWVLKGMGFYVS